MIYLFSLQGTSQAPGLIPRIVLDVFQKVLTGVESAAAAELADDEASGSGQLKYRVKASYLEVYNEVRNEIAI